MGVSKVSAFGNLCIQMKIFAPGKIPFFTSFRQGWSEDRTKSEWLLDFSKIVSVIMEILALWLVEDCVISRDKHRARGDHNEGTKFQNGCLALRRCYQGSKGDKGKFNSKELKKMLLTSVYHF